jgi:hypothetical protein
MICFRVCGERGARAGFSAFEGEKIKEIIYNCDIAIKTHRSRIIVFLLLAHPSAQILMQRKLTIFVLLALWLWLGLKLITFLLSRQLSVAFLFPLFSLRSRLFPKWIPKQFSLATFAIQEATI